MLFNLLKKFTFICGILALSSQAFSRTSLEIRENKTASFNLFGGNNFYLWTKGFSAEYQINSSFSIGGQYKYSDSLKDIFKNMKKKNTKNTKKELKLFNDIENNVKSWSTHEFSAYTRAFLGNSFYVKAGLGYKSSNVELNFTDKDVSLSSLEVPLAIGNTWQWDYVNFGIEWVGYNIPVYKAELTRSDLTKDHKTMFAGMQNLGISLLNLSLGVAL